MTRSSDKPAISVVMPVHNALPYLDEAVKSILDQTKRDFEFVHFTA
jgi:glycosyltransferase involved in cell wall biosynthesis